MTITQPRGQWTAKVPGMGTLPVLCASDMDDTKLAVDWLTRDAKDTQIAQKQFDAVVRQLTAGNPDRKVRAVVIDADTPEGRRSKTVYEFSLADMKVDRYRNGTARYSYRLTDGHPLSA